MNGRNIIIRTAAPIFARESLSAKPIAKDAAPNTAKNDVVLMPKAFKDDYKPSDIKLTKEIKGYDLSSRDDAKLPSWWDEYINNKNIAYGVGDTLSIATTNARVEVANMLQTTIKSSQVSSSKIGNFTNVHMHKNNVSQITNVELHRSDYEVVKKDRIDGIWYVALRYLK